MSKELSPGKNTNDYIFIVPNDLAEMFYEYQIMQIFENHCIIQSTKYFPSERQMFHIPITKSNNAINKTTSSSSSLPDGYYVPYQVLPLMCVHVIGPKQAECHRLRRVVSPKLPGYTPSIYDLDGSMYSYNQTFEQGCNELVNSGYFE